MSLPALLEVSAIESRLESIFPVGLANRQYLIREISAKTIFTMLYIGAVDGERWAGPKHVYCMGNLQSRLRSDEERVAYANTCLKKQFQPLSERWYADNSRESIRDETLREGLIPVGAVSVRTGLATTSSLPRYSLQEAFASLFDPEISSTTLEISISAWQQNNLSHNALARMKLLNQSGKKSTDKVFVDLPNGERRSMDSGLSSVITKAVIEEFSKVFMDDPVVIWISQSGEKVVLRDDATAQSIGLHIDASRVLPDVILAEVRNPLLLVFVEVVASDGPITEQRKQDLLALTRAANFDDGHVAFVTAFEDRSSAQFRKSVSRLARGSFAWCLSEPETILYLSGDQSVSMNKLRDFMRSR